MVSRTTFDAMAIRLFDTFGDLIENVTYTIVGAWNPVTETNGTTTESLRVSVRPIKRSEADGDEVMVGDLAAKIIQSEMVATPKIDDRMTLAAIEYIVRAVADNHGVTWELELRRL